MFASSQKKYEAARAFRVCVFFPMAASSSLEERIEQFVKLMKGCKEKTTNFIAAMVMMMQ
jgi:hypothetical protein